MAWDLWSSSYDQVVYEDYDTGPEQRGWQCDYYFGYGRDVLEEDALNVKSCVEVLRTLIKKAGIEIDEFEYDLLSLQNELARVELEHEICSGALNEKIEWCDVPIRSLKTDDADDAESETQLLLHNKPDEDYCEDEHRKLLDVDILNPILNVSGQAVAKEWSNIDSNILMKEEEKELSGISSENSTS